MKSAWRLNPAAFFLCALLLLAAVWTARREYAVRVPGRGAPVATLLISTPGGAETLPGHRGEQASTPWRALGDHCEPLDGKPPVIRFDRATQDALRRAAWTAPDADARSRALLALSPRDEANLPFVRDAVWRDPDAAVRRRAVLKLADWAADPTAIDTLLQLLERATDPELRSRAALALGLAGPLATRPPLTQNALVRAASDRSQAVQRTAAFVLDRAFR